MTSGEVCSSHNATFSTNRGINDDGGSHRFRLAFASTSVVSIHTAYNSHPTTASTAYIGLPTAVQPLNTYFTPAIISTTTSVAITHHPRIQEPKIVGERSFGVSLLAPLDDVDPPSTTPLHSFDT